MIIISTGGVEWEVVTAFHTFIRTYYFCESGCHRSVLTYHNGIIASRPSDMRSVVLMSRMVARVGACDRGEARRDATRAGPAEVCTVTELVRGEAVHCAGHFYVSCMRT